MCAIWHVPPVTLPLAGPFPRAIPTLVLEAAAASPSPYRPLGPFPRAIPTLVLEGQYDPITPPGDGTRTARALHPSYAVEFPGTGHAVYDFAPGRCATRIVQAFLAAPAQRPDTRCVATLQGPAFLLPGQSLRTGA